jgi:NAD-dependent SIR2 family protein deacetylase
VLEAIERILRGRRVAVLTGAGCSTESGIPDYRGPETQRRARNPLQYREFMRDPRARARYWARSMIGWPRIRDAVPNAAHEALAEMERAGIAGGVITQNVDRLHHRAGSRRVIELHGALAEVHCLECGVIESRDSLQARLQALNPGFGRRSAEIAPDGDAELALFDDFRVASCLVCDGVLKPKVVFFGESVPRPVVDAAKAMVAESEALLVVGSSLAVFSGFRFVRLAKERNLPVAIVNLGPTRADELADVCVDARAGALLPELRDSLVTRAAG